MYAPLPQGMHNRRRSPSPAAKPPPQHVASRVLSIDELFRMDTGGQARIVPEDDSAKPETQQTYERTWFLTFGCLVGCNSFTVLVHFIFFCAALAALVEREPKLFFLKVDSVHGVLRPQNASAAVPPQDLVQLRSPWTGSQWASRADNALDAALQCNRSAWEAAKADADSPYAYANRLLMDATCDAWRQTGLQKALRDVPQVYSTAAAGFRNRTTTLISTCYSQGNGSKAWCDQFAAEQAAALAGLESARDSAIAENTSRALGFMERNCYAQAVAKQVVNYTLVQAASNRDPLQGAVSISQTCRAARPNALRFAGSQNFTVDIWTYPVDAGSPINMGWCVCAFFLLSFAFQLSAMCCGGTHNGPLSYSYLFPGDDSGDDRHVSFVRTPNSGVTAGNKEVLRKPGDIVEHTREEMRFNWLRFVEYSASGSLVLFTAAILVGVTDLNLLMCIFLLSATCMLLGIAAEICLRVKNALKMVLVVPRRVEQLFIADQAIRVQHTKTMLESVKELKVVTTDGSKTSCIPLTTDLSHELSMVLDEHLKLLQDSQDTLTCLEPVDTMINMLRIGFWLTHLLGWACIVLPWAIVYAQLDKWYEPCGAEALSPPLALLRALGVALDSAGGGATDTGRKPPAFVRVSCHLRAVACSALA